MPYLPEDDRDYLAPIVGQIESCGIVNCGEMQYIIASMIDWYLRNNTVRYKTLESIMGALSGAQQEFYREVVAPYKDRKRNQHGTVYQNEKYYSNNTEGNY